MDQRRALLEMTSDIVAAYVSNHEIKTSDLPNVISSVFVALSGLGDAPMEEQDRNQPAVPIKKSITPEYIICLEDGKRFKSLRRHLRTKYNMSPEQYRAKWGLPNDYPMVAPNYARARSDLAKKMGLGRGAR